VPLRVRRADVEDLQALLGLLSQLHEDEPPLGPGPARLAALDRILSAPGRVLLLAEGEGLAIGTLDLLIVENLTRGGRPWATIENLVVDRAHRRLGAGGALLSAATEIAREAGCYKLQLVSHSRRAGAHALYEQAGFDALVTGFRQYL